MNRTDLFIAVSMCLWAGFGFTTQAIMTAIASGRARSGRAESKGER